MTTVLVTGGSGFIGSTLIRHAIERGFHVKALLRKTSDVSHLKGLSFEKVEGHLGDLASLEKAVQDVDIVFHLAGVVRAPSREDFFKHNSDGTKRLAQAVANANPSLKRFVLVSSLAAAGPASSLETPNLETHPESPVSTYGESKLSGERELLRFKDQFPVAIVRPPMVYGPRDKDIFVVIQTVSRRMMPVVRGATPKGDKFYSLIHAHDLCDGILRAGAADVATVPSGEVFYLTDGGLYSYRDLLRAMAAALGVKALEFQIPPTIVKWAAAAAENLGRLTKKTYPLNQDKVNEILPDFWICSTDKAKQKLGFTPRFDLATGMADAIRWYKEEKWL